MAMVLRLARRTQLQEDRYQGQTKAYGHYGGFSSEFWELREEPTPKDNPQRHPLVPGKTLQEYLHHQYQHAQLIDLQDHQLRPPRTPEIPI
jgi:hypothetical protein